MFKSDYLERFGLDNVEWFVKNMVKLENGMFYCFFSDEANEPILLIKGAERKFQKPTECLLGETLLTPWSLSQDKIGNVWGKLRDHCHLTGKYTDAAHSECNPEAVEPKLVQIVFHNRRHYDSHPFLDNLQEMKK